MRSTLFSGTASSCPPCEPNMPRSAVKVKRSRMPGTGALHWLKMQQPTAWGGELSIRNRWCAHEEPFIRSSESVLVESCLWVIADWTSGGSRSDPWTEGSIRSPVRETPAKTRVKWYTAVDLGAPEADCYHLPH